MGKKFAAVIAAAAIVASGSALVATPAEAKITNVTSYGPQAFDKENCDSFVNRLVYRIKGVPSGGTIRLAAYLLDSPGTVNGLLDAHNRGVNVQVVVDPAGITSQPARTLRAKLGFNRLSPSFFHVVNLQAYPRSNSNMHMKLFQVSSSGKDKFISIVGTANPAWTNGCGSYNINEEHRDRSLYIGLRRYFDHIVANSGKALPAKYQVVRSDDKLSKTMLYPSSRDYVLEYMRSIKSCAGGRTIRIMTFQWADSEVERAIQAWRLAKIGCRVEVIINYAAHRNLFGERVARVLLQKYRGKRLITIHNTYIPNKGYNHGKTLIDSGSKSIDVAISGSANWQEKATRNNDCTTYTRDAAVVARYQAWFAFAWKNSTLHTIQPDYSNLPAAGQSLNERDYDTI